MLNFWTVFSLYIITFLGISGVGHARPLNSSFETSCFIAESQFAIFHDLPDNRWIETGQEIRASCEKNTQMRFWMFDVYTRIQLDVPAINVYFKCTNGTLKAIVQPSLGNNVERITVQLERHTWDSAASYSLSSKHFIRS